MEITGFILAAGMGTRLGELTREMPKSLLDVHGKPMIAYGLQFLADLGVTQRCVIGGFQFPLMAETARALDAGTKTVENTEYKKGSATTLRYGLDHLAPGAGFVVMTADHLFRKDIPLLAREQFSDTLMIFTDRDRVLTNDDMKVELDAGKHHVVRMSKTLETFDCGYVGFSFCPASLVETVRSAIPQAIATFGENANVEHVWQWLADHGHAITTGDISGSKWVEVDMPDELDRARVEVDAHADLYRTIV
ncbi:MAG: NTP transferase domain-containing protein [Patescibacteria group bacterium]